MPDLSYNVPLSFAAVVQAFSERPAVRFSAEAHLTYSQLDGLSNRIARFLIASGVQKGDRLAFCLDKGKSAYVLPLAALKIGAPYFFLDPRNPPARMASILEQCRPAMLFHHQSYTGPETGLQSVICPEGIKTPGFIADFDDQGLPAEASAITGGDAAYIMFTSGSTGFPKGAVISHDNLIHFIEWIRDALAFTPDDIHTHLNPLYFDNSVFDYFATIFTGGQLVPFDHETVQRPPALITRLKEFGCTVWFSVPSLLMFLQTMKVLTRDNLGGLRQIMFGGEGYPKARLKDLFDEMGGQAKILNVYGPTECTCICSCYEISLQDFSDLEGLPPLGHLNPNFSYRLVDGDFEVAPGEIGELCLSGSCVGLGYFGQPAMTAKSFVQNPLNRFYREIVYRSGDLVRLEPADGKLYFVGRLDSQIKHMGYRIELEEIQHALALLEGVDEAVALQKTCSGISEIVAVVASSHPLQERDLRRSLEAHLPKYMVPSRIHVVGQMPKNPNGKTDRQQLARIYSA